MEYVGIHFWETLSFCSGIVRFCLCALEVQGKRVQDTAIITPFFLKIFIVLDSAGYEKGSNAEMGNRQSQAGEEHLDTLEQQMNSFEDDVSWRQLGNTCLKILAVLCV